MDTIVARIVASYCDATIEMRVFIVRLFATRTDRAPRVLSSSSLCFSIFFFFPFFFLFTQRLGFLAKEQRFAQLRVIVVIRRRRRRRRRQRGTDN